MVIPPILDNKHTSVPSVFAPAALLREARRRKGLVASEVPPVCILDPDGDLVRELRRTGAVQNRLGYLRMTPLKTNIALGQRRSEMMASTSCCFRGRTVDQVTHLVQGPDLLICDICVEACVDMLATKDHGWRAPD